MLSVFLTVDCQTNMIGRVFSRISIAGRCDLQGGSLAWVGLESLTDGRFDGWCTIRPVNISHRQLGPLRGSSSPFQHFEPARVKPN